MLRDAICGAALWGSSVGHTSLLGIAFDPGLFPKRSTPMSGLMDDLLAEKTSRRDIYIQAGALLYDPSALPDLSARVSREAVPVSGIPFDTKNTTGQKVDCALCGRKENHFRGFVVSFEDGCRAVIGRDCGERELFDQGAWKAMEAHSEQRMRQALHEARAAPAIDAIDKLSLLFDRCEASMKVLSVFLAEVSNALPELHDALTGQPGRGGELVRYDPARRVYATIPTLAPFKREKFGGALLRVRQGVQRAQKMLHQQAGLSLVQQAEAFRLLRTCERLFQDLHADAKSGMVYLTHPFWKGVAKWANAHPARVEQPSRYGTYHVSHRFIRYDDGFDDGGATVEIALPGTLAYSLEPFEAAVASWPRL